MPKTRKPAENPEKRKKVLERLDRILAIRIRAKPRHDVMDIKHLLNQRINMKKLIGDSAYDAESIHELAHENGIITVIKPKKNVRRGHYRKKQLKNYSERTYHRRSMIESGFSSLKRKYGSSISAKEISTQRAEIYCKVISYNLNLKFEEIFN